MKLHLPKGLRTALLACFAAFAGIGTTITTATVTGGVFAVTIASQAHAAVEVTADTSTGAQVTGSGTTSVSLDTTGSYTITANAGGGTVTVAAGETATITNLNLSALTTNTDADLVLGSLDGGTMTYTKNASQNENGLGFGSWSSTGLNSDLTLYNTTISMENTGVCLGDTTLTVGKGSTLYADGMWNNNANSKLLVDGGKVTINGNGTVSTNFSTYGVITVTNGGTFEHTGGTGGATRINAQKGAAVEVSGSGSSMDARSVNFAGAASSLTVADGATFKAQYDHGVQMQGDDYAHTIKLDNADMLVAKIAFNNNAGTSLSMTGANSNLYIGTGGITGTAGTITLDGGGTLGATGSGWSTTHAMTMGDVYVYTTNTSAAAANISLADVTGMAGKQITLGGSGTLTLTGTVALHNAIVMEAGATLALADGAVIDVSNLAAAGEQGYTFLTAAADNTDGSNLSIESLTGVQIIGAELDESKVVHWTLTNGTLAYEYLTSLVWDGGDMAEWKAGTVFSNNLAYADGMVATFNGTDAYTVTLAEDISLADMIVDATNMTLAGSNTLTVETLTINAGKELTSNVAIEANGIANSGTLTIANTVNVSSIDNSGTLNITNGVTLEPGSLDNSGKVVLNGGGLKLGSYSNTGTLATGAQGGTLAVDSTLNFNTGTLSLGGVLTKTGSGTLKLNTATTATDGGGIKVSAGQLWVGSAPGNSFDAVLGDVTLESGTTLVWWHKSVDNSAGDLIMNGGAALHNEDMEVTSSVPATTWGTLYSNGDAANKIQYNWKGLFNFAALTGDTDVTLVANSSMTGSTSGQTVTNQNRVTSFDSLTDFNATLKDEQTNGHKLYVNGASQGDGKAATVSGSTRSNGFTMVATGTEKNGSVTFEDAHSAEGNIDLQSGVLTFKGGLTMTQDATFSNAGALTLGGTVKLGSAIAMSADATLTLLKGTSLDVSLLASAGTNAYTLLTGVDGAENLSYDLTGISIVGVSGLENTVGAWELSNGILSYVEATELTWDGSSDLAWGTGTEFTTGGTYDPGEVVILKGTEAYTVTVAEDTQSGKIAVEASDVTLDGTAQSLTTGLLVIEEGAKLTSNVALSVTNSVTNAGTLEADGGLTVDGLLTNDGATLTIGANSSVGTYSGADGASLTVAEGAEFVINNAGKYQYANSCAHHFEQEILAKDTGAGTVVIKGYVGGDNSAGTSYTVLGNTRVEGNMTITNGGKSNSFDIAENASLTIAKNAAVDSLASADSYTHGTGNLWLQNKQTLTVKGTLDVAGHVLLGHKDTGDYYSKVIIDNGTVALGGLFIVNNDSQSMLELSGGTLILGDRGIADRHDAGSGDSRHSHVTLNNGTVASSYDTQDLSHVKVFGSAGKTLTIDTTKYEKDATTGAWAAAAAGTAAAITHADTLTLEGTVNATGSGSLTLTSTVTNNGILNVGTTLALTNAITMSADAQFNLLAGGLIDVTNLQKNAAGDYVLLTAADTTQANLDISTLTIDNLTGYAGSKEDYECEFNQDGTFTLAVLSYLSYDEATLDWVDGATGFETKDGSAATFANGSADASGSSVAFAGTTIATLGEAIAVDKLRVEQDASLTVNDSETEVEGVMTPNGYTLSATTIKNSGDLALNVATTATGVTNEGEMTANAALTATTLTNSGTLTANGELATTTLTNSGSLTVAETSTAVSLGAVSNSGVIELGADSSLTSYASSAQGSSYSVAASKTLTYNPAGTGSDVVNADIQGMMSLLRDNASTAAGGTVRITPTNYDGTKSWGYGVCFKDLLASGETAQSNSVEVVGNYVFDGNWTTFMSSAAQTITLKGGSMTLEQLVISDNVTFVLDGGELSLSGHDHNYGLGLKAEGDVKRGEVELKSGTISTVGDNDWNTDSGLALTVGAISVKGNGTISLLGATTFAGTVDNQGNLVLGSAGAQPTLSLKDGDLSQLSSDLPTSGRVSGNGFAQTVYYLVKAATVGEDEAKPTLTLNSDGNPVSITIDDTPYELTAADGSLTFVTDATSGIYYVNEDTVTYGGEASDMTIANVTALQLSGGNVILASGLDAATTGGIIVKENATIDLASDSVTLKGADIHNDDSKTVTLTGSGVYTYTSADQFNAVTGFADADNWTGTVSTTSNSVTFDNATTALSALGNANSTVAFTGVTGNFASGTLDSDLILVNSHLCAVEFTKLGDGNTYDYVFTGDITSNGKDGHIKRFNDTSTSTVNLTFSGDISAWKGDLHNDCATGDMNVTFTGDATEVNVDLMGDKLNVTYAGTGETLVTSANSTYGGATTISSGTVKLASGVKALGATTSIAAGAGLHLQGNQLTNAITSAGTVTMDDGSSITSLSGGALTVTGGTVSMTTLADASLELAGKLTVNGALTGLTSLTVADSLGDLCSASSALVSADSATLGSTLTVSVLADAITGRPYLSTDEGGDYLLLSSEADIDLTNTQLVLDVAGNTGVKDNGDGSFVVGQITYSLGISADNKSIVLTGSFEGSTWDDNAAADPDAGTDGNTWASAGTGADGLAGTVTSSSSIIAFAGSDDVTIDASQTPIEVSGVRVETETQDGAYTFTGKAGDGSDTILAESLMVLNGSLTINAVTVGGLDPTGGDVIVGKEDGSTTTALNLGDKTTVTAGQMTIYADNGTGVNIAQGATLHVNGALNAADGTTITNSGTLIMGNLSSVDTIAGENGTVGAIMAMGGAKVDIDSVDGLVSQMTTGRGAVVTVGNDLEVASLTNLGTLELSSVDENGGTNYHELTVTTDAVQSIGGTVIAGSVDATAAASVAVAEGDAAALSFNTLKTDKITLDVTNLATAGTTPMLHVSTLEKLTPATTLALDDEGGVQLELTGIPSGTVDGIGAADASDATAARDWAKAFAEGQYTLMSYGTAVGGLSLVTPSLVDLQQLFALDGMDAIFRENTVGSTTYVVLTLAAATDREWTSSEPGTAGKPNATGDEVKLGIDLTSDRDTLAVATYDMFNTVQKVTMDGNYTLNLVGQDMTQDTDTSLGLVIRDLDGTGTLTLVGDGATQDLATLVTSTKKELEGNVVAQSIKLQVQGEELKVVDVTLDAATLDVQGTLAATGALNAENGSLAQVSGTLTADTATLTGSDLEVESTGSVEVTGLATMTDAEVNIEGSFESAGMTVTDSAVTVDGATASLDATGAAASLTDSTLDVEGGAKVDLGDTKLTSSTLTVEQGSLDAGAVTLADADAKLISTGATGKITLSALNGTAGEIQGTIAVDGTGGDYSGNYGTDAALQLAADATQNLTIGGQSGSDNLALSADAGAASTLTYSNGDAELKSLNTTGADITLVNTKDGQTNTLTLGAPSSMVGGSLTVSTHGSEMAEGANSAVITDGAALALENVNVTVQRQDDTIRKTFDVTQGTEDITVLVLSEGAASTGVTVTFVDKDGNADAFANRYFENVEVKDGKVVADLVTDYYTSRLEETANGAAGLQMADMAFLEINPQDNRADYADLANVLDALDTYAATPGGSTDADKLGAAVAGSGLASLGMALSGDVERQLKAIRNRTTTMGVDPAVVNEDMPYFNAWINAEGDYREMDADSTLAGYDMSSWGGTVGFDMDVNPSLTWGLAFTAMYGDFTADAADKVEGDVESYYVSAFARAMSGAWVHTFVATVGMNTTELSRTVSHSHGSYTTDGEAEGTSFGLLYEVARTFALNEDATACWQPVLNVAYRHIDVDGYTETGSDAALQVGDQSMDVVTFGLGARLQAIVGENIYNRTSVFEARALAKLDAGDRESELDTALINSAAATGTVKSAELDAFGVELGAGLTVPVGIDSGSIFLDGSVEFRGSYINGNATLGYRVNF